MQRLEDLIVYIQTFYYVCASEKDKVERLTHLSG